MDWRAKAEKSNSSETKNNNTFNRWCINKYYEVSAAAFRSVNSNHMLIGDKINAYLYDLSELELVVEEMNDYVEVCLPGNRPASGAELRAQLNHHDFLWGAVIRDVFFTSPHSDTYKKTFLKYFNATGFGIELKPKWRDSDRERTAYEQGMPWINANNIYMRGHALPKWDVGCWDVTNECKQGRSLYL